MLNFCKKAMNREIKKLLEKQGYRIIGSHSAVKLCHWTRERLLRKRSCYKSKFYGIASHRCLQMTPSVAWCQHACLFCWRPVEHTLGSEFTLEPDEPEEIVEASIEAQRKLLSGYGGEARVSKEELREALEPKHVAISLAGEPTNYPYIAELIEAYKSKGMTTFLVTNGMNPEKIAQVKPTSLYLSVISPDEQTYRRLNRPRVKDGWERFNQSLEVFGSKKGTRRVVRITLVKGYNLEKAEKFASLIEKANPDYIEAKGYVHVGYSRQRLNRENMPAMEEVESFAKTLAQVTGYEIADRSLSSKVVLLKR